MQKKVFTLIIIFFSSLISAQFTDDMESYTDGSTIYTGHWTDWNQNGNTALYASSVHAYSGNLAAYVPPDGTTDALLSLGNQTSGQWGIKFMMFIPSGKEADINLQSQVPVSGGYHTVGDIYFNKDNNDPGTGYVKYNSSDPAQWSFFHFPHDQWFEVIINIHINNNWQMLINGNVEIDWTAYGRWVSNGVFNYSDALGGVNFWSRNSLSEYWIDDISFTHGFQSSSLSVEINDTWSNITIYPNPVKDILHLTINNTYTYQIISLTGCIIQSGYLHNQDSINVSALNKGVYLIKFVSKSGIVSYKKFIKS